MKSIRIETITESMVTEFETYKFVIEASSLQIPPGVVPQRLKTTMGNLRDFLLTGGNEQEFTYRQELGNITLKVLND